MCREVFNIDSLTHDVLKNIFYEKFAKELIGAYAKKPMLGIGNVCSMR
jgi:hypothetical protein